MKKYLALCLSLCISVFANAQATDLVVDCQTPGWLSSKINYGDQQTVKNLKVTGYINSDDLKFIGTLINNFSLDGRVDLSDVQIVNNDMGVNAFGLPTNSSELKSLKCLLLPSSLKSSYAILSKKTNGGKPTAVIHTDTLNINWQNSTIVGYDIGGDITHLILGENIDSIPDGGNYFHGMLCLNTFEGVSNLQSVQFGIRMRYIGKNTFQSLPIKSVFFPQTLKYIGDNAFKGHKIKEISLPDSMDYLGENSFSGDKIEHVNLPVKLRTLGNNAFNSYCPDTILVPQGISKFYMESFGFKSGQVRVFPESVIEIDNGTQGKFAVDSNMVLYLYSPKVVKINECKYVSVGYQSKGTGSIEEALQDARKGKALWKVFVPKEMVEKYKISDYWYKTYTNKTGQTYINYWVYSYWFNANIVEMNPVETVTLNEHQLTMNKKEQFSLSVTITPEDADDKTIAWTSDDESIATVNENGVVTAVKEGQTKIYAKSVATGIQDFCTVLVRKNVTGISLNEAQITFSNIADTKQLVATVLPEDATDKSVTWSSSNEQVCKVSAAGLVTATGIGSTLITATTVDGGLTANCVVKVLQHVDGLNLNKTNLSLKVGESEKLHATIVPSNADNKKVIWTCSNKDVATVDTEGNVTAVKAGQVTITATSEDNAEIKATCAVTVIQPVTGITLSESAYKLKAIGENIQLTATVLPEDATNKKVNWNCPNNTVCIVSNGNVVAIGYGTAVIIATTEDGGFVATCTITVEDTSGIIEVKSDHNDNLPTYDTMGRKVQELKKGQLYIRQGKKFVVK